MRFYEMCRRTAAEGAVLLKNEKETLPIKKGETISVFGRCQFDTYRSGTGSGGAVNVPYAVSLIEGLKNCEEISLNDSLTAIYEEWINKNPFDRGNGGWASEPWNQEEMVITEEIVNNAAQCSGKAIYVIGRTAGEDKDYVNEPGSFLLTDIELENLRILTGSFEKVAVLMNVSNVIDMSWIENPAFAGHVTAVLYLWQGGMETGNAAADLLCGKIIPSGKLTDTIAKKLEDYPAWENFGDFFQNIYEEDIYVGYRYFETFCPEKVLYEFGYGLSYTNFSIKGTAACCGQRICITAKVKNIGNYSGKEVVQVYVEAPQGALGKPYRELKAFAKTRELLPGEAQQLILEIPIECLASYDDSGATGNRSCYVLEKGLYRFYIGNSVRTKKLLRVDNEEGYFVSKPVVVRKLQEALAPSRKFERIKPKWNPLKERYDSEREEVPLRTVNLEERIKNNLPKEIPVTGNLGIRLSDVKVGKSSLRDFVGQMTEKELATIVRGEGMCSPKVTAGTAAAFGGVSDALYRYGIPAACCADGPSGIRMETGEKSTQLPIGTLLACTFNVPLIEELYEFEGKELTINQIDTLLGPGINIHRHPLNGRNFEYFSEDPYVTGCFAAAVVRGVKKGGSTATVKHFAANNQENQRYTVDAVVSERALREIYLKAFEMAVKEGKAVSIMTSFNLINGHYSSSNYDLNTWILRNEWEFRGIVMTDWWAEMNDPVMGGACSKKLTSAMIRAQNDLYMVVDNNGAEVNAVGDDTVESLNAGNLTLGELQRSAKNICSFLLDAPVMERPLRRLQDIQKINPLEKFSEEKFLEIEERVIIEHGEKKYLHVSEGGVYSIVAQMVSPQPDQAQATVNVFLNNQRAVIIQMGGTRGTSTVQKLANVNLEAGYYELLTEEIKPKMKFEWIEFRKND